MQKKPSLVWFNEVSKEDIGLVGGKGANLGEITQAGFPVPFGFVVTSHAYFNFIKESGIQHKIESFLKNINYENPHELQQASKNIKSLIISSSISKSLAHQIFSYYSNLRLKEEMYLNKRFARIKKIRHKIKSLYGSPLVAVRSSATAEDLPGASFAGQQETFLNVRGENNLIQKIKECFASLFTERAIFYRHEKGFDHFKVGLAAVVQRMIQSEKSGIAFSIDPVTNDRNKIVIEGAFGLGEYVVQGKVTPDHYEVDKNSFVLLKKEIKRQEVEFVRWGKINKEVKLPKSFSMEQKLNDDEILKVAFLVKDIEKHYYFPQDLEWAIEKGRVYIVQTRPITTVGKDESKIKSKNYTPLKIPDRLPVLTGAPASPGIRVGPVTIIHSPQEIEKINKGDVLVAPQTNPDYVPAMRKAIAIITEKGGRTSHAAIVSRELGIPAVVGAEKATHILKENEIVSVDGSSGEIFKGSILSNGHKDTEKAKPQPHHAKIKTTTKVYVNLAEPQEAKKVSEMDTDGVGLLRAEFMIADIGTHPQEFIKQKKEKEFITILTKKLHTFVESFDPRPVIYRATDFKTNEYRHLKGGKKYEAEEENPMLGFRGASRYIANPEVFLMELEAIKNIWNTGRKNLHLMIPFVRRPWELLKIKEIINSSGLFDYEGFKLYIMVEVPSSALELEKFIEIGIDGVSIGTNDLTMMVLGVDRDNAEVAPLYDERSTAVVSLLEKIVSTCVKFKIPCSICGQAASDYPELVEKLVKLGITSVSVNPDAVERTREIIYHIEKNIHKGVNR